MARGQFSLRSAGERTQTEIDLGELKYENMRAKETGEACFRCGREGNEPLPRPPALCSECFIELSSKKIRHNWRLQHVFESQRDGKDPELEITTRR